MKKKKWNPIPGKGKNLRHYYDTQFAPAHLTNLSPHSAYKYEAALAQLDMFLGRAAKLTDLSDEVVSQLIAWLKKEHGQSPGSVCKTQDCLVCFWRFLFRRRIVDSEPNVKAVVVPARTPVAWRPEELHRLFEYFKRLPGDIAGVPTNLWFLSLYAAMWNTGERVGSLLQTTWSDVDLTGGWITIRPETRKGCMTDKLSRLQPQTVAYLKAILEPRRALVWYWPWNRYLLWTRHKQLLQRAGLPADRFHSFHIMRKSVASYTKLAGGNASQVLGHADPKLTESTYIDPRIAPGEFAADVLPPLDQIMNWRPKDAG